MRSLRARLHFDVDCKNIAHAARPRSGTAASRFQHPSLATVCNALSRPRSFLFRSGRSRGVSSRHGQLTQASLSVLTLTTFSRSRYASRWDASRCRPARMSVARAMAKLSIASPTGGAGHSLRQRAAAVAGWVLHTFRSVWPHVCVPIETASLLPRSVGTFRPLFDADPHQQRRRRSCGPHWPTHCTAPKTSKASSSSQYDCLTATQPSEEAAIASADFRKLHVVRNAPHARGRRSHRRMLATSVGIPVPLTLI